MSEFFHQQKKYYSTIEFAIAHIGGVWKMPILLALRNGPVRYGNLKESIPHISDKMLFTQLKELEERKMVTRHAYVEKPPRVEYQLTDRALKALPILDLLQEYGHYLATEEGCL
ncbi:helix-turn-helix domain-containing protein [Paraflavitalea sp. CAU 1676]|uniref:winged helix-turn-helix transcriptional regulator n=1 Tax=Paraflavitalea sp. CAU 1676 TaxID=3032598 RepID=UPI0023DBE275|nr:helix-turn-helix domain-containing protein [Paraflavitalea sp. CAU 1676]MDF2188518.1 helix-turn-helix domain-containing protein [Paraflavitalea sp. CAU 1676]